MRRLTILLVLTVPGLAFSQDAPKEKPFLVFETGGHTGIIHKLLFTPDGKQLITVSEDKTIRIWDVETGQAVKVLRPPIGPGAQGSLFAAALSPDGKLLAVAGYGFGDDDKSTAAPIHVINLAEGRVQQVLKGHAGGVHGLAFAADNKRLASGGAHDAHLQIWRLNEDKPEPVRLAWKGDKYAIHHVSFSPDGKYLAATKKGQHRIWDLSNLKHPKDLKGSALNSDGGDAAWSPDSQTLATADGDGLRLWNSDGTLRKEIKNVPKAGTIAFSADGSKLLCDWTESDKRLSVIDLATEKEEVVFPKHARARTRESVFSPDGKLAASADSLDHSVYLWKTADGSVVHHLGKWDSWPPVRKAGWNADGTKATWDTRSFHLTELRFDLPVKLENVRNGALKQGELTLVDSDSGIKVMNGNVIVATLKVSASIAKNSATFLGKDRAVTSNKQGNLFLFNTNTGELIRRVHAHQETIRSLAPSPDNRYILSSSYDRTLVVWNPEQANPLLYLMLGDNKKGKPVWVAWTPEGYYAASSDGEKLLGWHVNNGPDQLGTFHPAAKFRPSLYRPDVIQRLLQEGSLDKALEAADKARGTKSEKFDIDSVLPPRVKLTAPTAALLIAEPELEVKAVAESVGKHPVTALQLMFDGRPFLGEKGIVTFQPARLGKVEASWKIEMPPGAHRLSVVARSAVSTANAEEVEVTYESGVRGHPNTQLPALYLLAIGINTYPGDWKLNCAANDAVQIERIFKDKSLPVFRDVQTKLLTDQQASRQGILDGLAWLKKQMKPQDVAVIFYAGHGARGDKGRFFLLPADVDVSAMEKTGVSGDEVKNRLAELPGRVLLLLDACHAGAIGARGKGALTDELTRALSDDDCGVVVICAAMGREEAGEERKLGHGYFALALVEGLSGKADVSKRDGRVYLHHLEHYVIDRVQELSNDEQHPVVGKPTTVRSFALSKP